MLGYDAYNLLYGIPSWGTNDKITYPFKAEQSGNYKVSTEAAQLEGTFTAPKPLGDTVEAAAQAYFPGGFKAMKAADLFANLNDGDDSNDPVILDVRSAEDYALGHIAGCGQRSRQDLFTAGNLAKLPADKQIVSYCYSGQTASQVTGCLAAAGLRCLQHAVRHAFLGDRRRRLHPGVGCEQERQLRWCRRGDSGRCDAAAAAAPAAPLPPPCPPPAAASCGPDPGRPGSGRRGRCAAATLAPEAADASAI